MDECLKIICKLKRGYKRSSSKNILRKNAECIEMINIDAVACQWERNISDALMSPKCKIWKFVTTEQHVSKRVR